MATIAGEEFADNLACLTCIHVLEGDRIRLVSRDDEDEWQFLCGQSVHEPFEARVVSLDEAVSLDGRLCDLAPMKIGELRSI